MTRLETARLNLHEKLRQKDARIAELEKESSGWETMYKGSVELGRNTLVDMVGLERELSDARETIRLLKKAFDEHIGLCVQGRDAHQSQLDFLNHHYETKIADLRRQLEAKEKGEKDDQMLL